MTDYKLPLFDSVSEKSKCNKKQADILFNKREEK